MKAERFRDSEVERREVSLKFPGVSLALQIPTTVSL